MTKNTREYIVFKLNNFTMCCNTKDFYSKLIPLTLVRVPVTQILQLQNQQKSSGKYFTESFLILFTLYIFKISIFFTFSFLVYSIYFRSFFITSNCWFSFTAGVTGVRMGADYFYFSGGYRSDAELVHVNKNEETTAHSILCEKGMITSIVTVLCLS